MREEMRYLRGVGRVLVSSPLPGRAVERLEAEHEVVVGEDPRGLGRARLEARIADFDGLLSLLSDPVDAALLARAPRLRVVANCAVGFDNVDLEACRARGVVVCNTPGVLTEATADFTLALILAACRRVAEGDRLVRSGAWRGWSPTELLGVRVTGASLGLVGFGRIGRAVAARARGFSMRVRYASPRRAPPEIERELGAEPVTLERLLAESDVACLCVPLLPETRGLLSRDRIFSMKRGAVLVNTSRGPCVDEEALADALEQGHLAAAGLDVYAREPEVPARLRTSPHAVLAPHIASADGPTRAAMAERAAEGLLDVLAGRPPRFRVA